jgi:SAM-dependent methyltransferase
VIAGAAAGLPGYALAMAHADDYCPLDDDTALMQLEAVLERCAGADGWILDLGCGDGRLALPLARAGARVLAIDHDPEALEAMERQRASGSLSGELVTLQADLQHLTAEMIREHAPGPIASALCLGHTFMLLHDPLDALNLLREVGSTLGEGGFLAIDDFPVDLWYEVSEGNWQSGIAEMEAADGSGTELWQMVWKPGDPVIALRRGEEVEADEIEILPSDRLHRLYSVGELRLLAACSGFGEPQRLPDEGLMLFSTGTSSASGR